MRESEYYCIGTKKEVYEYIRVMDFNDELMQSKFNRLSLENQKCMVNVINLLINNVDNVGYNLSKIMESYQKANKLFKQLSLSNMIAENRNDWIDGKGINNRIDYIKKANSFKLEDIIEDIKPICDFLLVDIELLISGIGKIYSIKDEWLGNYLSDSQKAKKFNTRAKMNKEKMYNTILRIRYYEEYLKETGVIAKDDTIIEEHWAVMKYCGKFLLAQSHGKKLDIKSSINCLMDYLYENQ